jgi:dTMP kinase
MVAARRSHLERTIWPALDRGDWVVCDRFADSTLAYQGYGGGVPLDDLATLHRLIAGDFMPDLTFVLDVPVAKGLKRAAGRSGRETRFERMDEDFHERLRQGFLDIARQAPARCVVIDAQAAPDKVHHAMLAATRERLGAKV